MNPNSRTLQTSFQSKTALKESYVGYLRDTLNELNTADMLSPEWNDLFNSCDYLARVVCSIEANNKIM